MISSRYYVIRHIPSGRLLPARVRATHHDFDLGGGGEPRLFTTERAAKNCATCWAQGAWAQETETRGGWDEPVYDELVGPFPNKVDGRRREDLEVVPVTLELLA